MQTFVFKFGGASINSAAGVENLGKILKRFPDHHIVLVVSAMGKTTNAFENLLKHLLNNDKKEAFEALEAIKTYHLTILSNLLPHDHPGFTSLNLLFDEIGSKIDTESIDQTSNYDFIYDQFVSYGELISTTIVACFLQKSGYNANLVDARMLIKTDNTYRDAKVDWEATKSLIGSNLHTTLNSKFPQVVITQGFIGGDPKGYTTTLGREGSDYSAAILAHCLGIQELTIWKDVPGVMNADPKWMKKVQKIDLLSYREAIELAYYGASVIHPKTIKPLENANILLHVKSFLKPEEPGTTIQNLKEWRVQTPFYIRKLNQSLISISPRDFSFIVEENLSQIFQVFAHHHIKVNVMQNSAISFTVCVDSHWALPRLMEELKQHYHVRYNEGAELYTIRHYTNRAIQKVVGKKTVLMEQKTRSTVHLVVIQEEPQGNRI